MPPSHLFGLTGGIASGKSTVAELLRQIAEIGVVDADRIYHELIAPEGGRPSPLVEQICAHFAEHPQLVAGDGTLRRAALAELVFGDSDARRALEQITHPAVRAEAQRRIAEEHAHGRRIVFYDVPLLFESGSEAQFDGVLVVWVPRAVQLERLMARNGLARHAAEARIAAQMSLDTKRERARWVVDNSDTYPHTCAQVSSIVRELKAG